MLGGGGNELHHLIARPVSSLFMSPPGMNSLISHQGQAWASQCTAKMYLQPEIL